MFGKYIIQIVSLSGDDLQFTTMKIWNKDVCNNRRLPHFRLATMEETKNVSEKYPTLDDLNLEEMARLIPTVIFLAIVGLVGLLGNSLVIHIYRTRYKFSNIKCFILSLSAVDLFTCCVAIPLEMVTFLDQYTFELGWLCKLSRCVNAICTNASTFLLIFIAIDRFRRIWNPTGWQINASAAKFSAVLSIFIAMTLSWPAIVVYGKETFAIPEYNLTGSECSTDDAMKETSFPSVYTLLFGILFIIGISLLVILYCLIGHRLRCHAKRMAEALGRQQKGQTGNQTGVRKTTFIMFLVTLAFILCFLPHLIVRQFKSEFMDDSSGSGNAVYRILTRSYFLNCAVNPVIYSLFDTRFRLACRKMFSRHISRKRDMTTSQNISLSTQNSSNLVTQVTSFIR